MTSWNVLFVGLGPLGRLIIGDFIERRLGTIASAVDVDPTMEGRPIGAFVPSAGASGVRIAPSIGAALKTLDPSALTCAVVATSSDLARCMPTLRELLARGVSIVSTCEELLYPYLRHASAAAELDALCKAHGARCVGTGVNPGFLMDTLPVTLSAVCSNVDRVFVERLQDATTRRVPFQQKIGATLSDDAFAQRVQSGVLRHVGLGESLHFIDRALSMGVVRWNETIQPVRASKPLQCALGAIPAGGISGVRQTAHGFTARGDEVITLEFQAAIGQEHPRDRVVITGRPTIESVVPGAVHGDIATSAITLNSIAPLLSAPAGLHTMASMPVTHFVRGV